MSDVFIRENECMERQYKDICTAYDCRAKVFTKMTGSFQNKIGAPNLLTSFSNTKSHKIVRSALCEKKRIDTVIARCHSNSMAALKGILDEHRTGGKVCPDR